MLQFKDIKQNCPVYLFNKTDVAVTQGKVTSASFPKMEYNPQTGQQQMMITFGIECEGKNSTYGIPENSSVVNAGDVVIATDKSLLLSEVETLNNNAVQFLESVDSMIERQKQVREKCEILMSELNPIYKERQETEKRFNAIESKFSSMEQTVNGMKEMLANFIKEMKS